MFKKLFGLAPKLESDGSYSPSALALKLATSDTTDFEPVSYTQYRGKRSKVLVIFTEQKNMKMQNGKLFSTGNHPVESLLPMLHLKNAGFEFDIATPTGKPVVLEMWAFPHRDQQVEAIYQAHKTQFEQPKSLHEFASSGFPEQDAYAAVFVPGGHGSMLGLPQNQAVADVLHWAHNKDLLTITLCHGPSSLLATTLNQQEFLYAGYNMAVFPDSVDNMTPMLGYLPGKMTWNLGKTLTGLGVNIVNTKADDTVCVDRNLLTGAAPQAANNLGKRAAELLLQKLQ